MNIQQMKYALMVAETGSINRASEKYFVEAPNLSRAIKALEASLGTAIFDRSAKGMVLTTDGEVFVQYARSVVKQVDAIENLFSRRALCNKRFSISVPRASYIAEAFSRFTARLDPADSVEIYYKETNAQRVIRNILQEDYTLGIIRYAKPYDKYFRLLLEEKGLVGEPVTEFRYVLLTGRDSDLAAGGKIDSRRLEGHIEIAHADPFVPTLPFSTVKKEELSEDTDRRIYVFERASQFELLSHNRQTYMWGSPVPQELLDRYGLVQLSCPENERIYQDVLIRRREYVLSSLDKLFLAELQASEQRTFH